MWESGPAGPTLNDLERATAINCQAMCNVLVVRHDEAERRISTARARQLSEHSSSNSNSHATSNQQIDALQQLFSATVAPGDGEQVQSLSGWISFKMADHLESTPQVSDKDLSPFVELNPFPPAKSVKFQEHSTLCLCMKMPSHSEEIWQMPSAEHHDTMGSVVIKLQYLFAQGWQ